MKNIRKYFINDYEYTDTYKIYEDNKQFHDIVNNATLLCKEWQIDRIIGIDAQGFLLAGAIAFNANLPLTVVRKEGKMNCHTISQEYEYGALETEKHTIHNENLLFIDDYYAFGHTMKCAMSLFANNKNYGFVIDGIKLPSNIKKFKIK